ncbi:MAG: hypothetical protein PHI68_02220 [Candidatus Cloacimonetes bacterium]|nr:hypothetical protein [Candidatus Cloacimonadota bacterium]
MSDQVQVLLQRVYDEGVAKAREEGNKIIEAAKAKAEELKAQAEKEAQSILASAQKKAEELSKNTHSDLKMASQQALSASKNKIADLILSETINKDISKAMGDVEFVKAIIQDALAAWKSSFPDGNLTLSENLKTKLDEYFISSLKALFNQKLQIDFSPTMKNGFSISPSDGSYKLSFTDEDFAELFKSFLRPRTNQILFQN